jgi:hypothetical protein
VRLKALLEVNDVDVDLAPWNRADYWELTVGIVKDSWM